MRVQRLRHCDDVNDYLWRIVDELRLIINNCPNLAISTRISELRNRMIEDLREVEHYKSLANRVATLESQVADLKEATTRRAGVE